MAAFLRASRRSLLSCCGILYSHGQQSSLNSSKHIFQFSRSHASQAIQKSPFESNILRILRNDFEYQLDYAPPHPVNLQRTMQFIYFGKTMNFPLSTLFSSHWVMTTQRVLILLFFPEIEAKYFNCLENIYIMSGV